MDGSSWNRLDTFTSLISSPYLPGEAHMLTQSAGTKAKSLLLQGQIYCSQLQFPASSAYFKNITLKDDISQYIYMLICDSYNHSLTGNCYALNANLLTLRTLAKMGDAVSFLAHLALSHLYAAMMLPSAASQHFKDAQAHLAPSGYELSIQLKIYMLHIYGKILSCDFANKQYGLSFYSLAGSLYPENHYPFFAATLYIAKAVILSAAGASDAARLEIKKACKLLKPDGFILPFGEFFTLFDQNLTSVIEEYWPENVSQLRMFWAQNIPHWIDSRNRLTGEMLTSKLTKREHEVAIRAALGLSNKEIAAQLGLSENTVKTFLRSIFNSWGNPGSPYHTGQNFPPGFSAPDAYFHLSHPPPDPPAVHGQEDMIPLSQFGTGRRLLSAGPIRPHIPYCPFFRCHLPQCWLPPRHPPYPHPPA